MPLGVLSVDVDKLLRHNIAIPQPPLERDDFDFSADSRRVPFKRQTPKRNVDCFLIKGDYNGAKVFSGLVRQPSASPRTTRIPTADSSSPLGSHRSTKPKKRLKHNDKGDDDGAFSDELIQMYFGSTVRYDTSESPVKLSWNPCQSFGHATMEVAPAAMARLREEEAIPMITEGKDCDSQSTASRPQGSAASDGTGSRSTRQNSARKVTLVDPAHAHRVASAHQQQLPSQPLVMSATPVRDGAPSPRRPGGEAGGRVSQQQLSRAAQTTLDSTLGFVKARLNAVSLLTGPTTIKVIRSVSQSPREQPKSSRCPSSRDRSTHSRASPEQIIEVLADAPRQQCIAREREHEFALKSMKRRGIFTTEKDMLPSTLKTFSQSLHSKADPVNREIFEVAYVKPNKVFSTKRKKERRVVECNDGCGDVDDLKEDERDVYAVIENHIFNSQPASGHWSGGGVRCL